MKRAELARHEKELGFVPRDSVRWLAPGELLRTAAQVLLAQIFANFGDKRELQEVFSRETLHLKERPRGDLWLDYTADLGDGFDATATVAALLSENELSVQQGNAAESTTLPRGHLLVLGGDEVYPTASARAYADRTLGPYAAALPADAELPRGNQRPSLLALPGNHDWYDGLTAFLRMFTRPRKIGARHTIQTRSYFVLRLGHGWWLVGLDSQFGEYIDEPQLNYFQERLTKRLCPNDAIILCTSAPTWVHTKTKDPNAFNQLHYFDKYFLRGSYDPEEGTLKPTGAHVRLWLSGDSHHYSRYEEVLPGTERVDDRGAGTSHDPRATQLITCGLGGAFLASTHQLPCDLTLPPPESRMHGKDDPPTQFRLARSTYPDLASSRAMSKRIAIPSSRFWLGWRNPSFAPLLGTVHLLLFLPLVWLFGVTELTGITDVTGITDMSGSPEGTGSPEVNGSDSWGLLTVLGSVAVCLVLASVVGASVKRGVVFAAIGLQLAVLLVLAIVTIVIPWPSDWPSVLVVGCAAVLVWVGGALLGTEVFALFTLSQRTGAVFTWQMSSQAVDDYKGFLRMRLHRNGDLGGINVYLYRQLKRVVYPQS